MSNLLVIDDDVQMLSSLTDVLSSAGYDVSGVSSGTEAVAYAESHPFDLVISDVRMAGMDGIETIQALSQKRADLRSIVITGYASDDVPGRAMDLSSCDYLFKPFTADQLIVSVSRALDLPQEVRLEDMPELMRETGRALAEMNTARKKAFSNFYLGVRSGWLTPVAARSVWRQLEAVETRRLELEAQLELRSEASTLTERYREVCESSRTRTPADSALPADGVSRIGFLPFFKNIRDGKTSCEDLKLASRARLRAQGDVGEQTDEDRELYAKIWA